MCYTLLTRRSVFLAIDIMHGPSPSNKKCVPGAVLVVNIAANVIIYTIDYTLLTRQIILFSKVDVLYGW